MKNKIHGKFLIDGEFIEAEVLFDKKILSIVKTKGADTTLPLIIPGFIDLHLHGGGGSDIMEGGNAIHTVAKTHARHGTTAFLATTVTAPFAELSKALGDLSVSFHKRGSAEARLLGVHLEGPYINQEKLGAQPDFVRSATLDEIKKLNQLVPIKILTLAPEIFDHLDLIPELKAMNITVQIGHSNGSYDDGVKALKKGAKSFTHLFNAMSSFHHRAPGMVGAALAHAEYAEIIPDLEHVHVGAILTALRSIPHAYFVTDATSATGMPDGDYKLGAHTVHKCINGVRLKDGTLAGSCLTMDQAFMNLIKIGLTPEEASRRLSEIPAQLLGLSDRGMIKEDFFADFLILNNDYSLKDIYIEGEKI